MSTASPPQVLIHEFVTGGGWTAPELPSGIKAEGLAMLHAVLEDFRAWGRMRTVTTLDTRLSGWELPAHQVIPVEPASYTATLEKLIDRCDAALVIAPESNGTLARVSDRIASAGVPLLGSSASGVSIAADKWVSYCRFVDFGLPTPLTRRATLSTAVAAARSLGFPLVVKPVDGEGCEGVTLVAEDAALHRALDQSVYQNRDFLLQQYIPGAHASVSLLVTTDRVLPLSLNKQIIHIDGSFAYRGGVVPFKHPRRDRVFKIAQQAVSLIPGLRGYVGVDLVLTDESAYLIEINPRLTTSYVGLRRVIDINLAEAIWNASICNNLPDNVIVSGTATFSKENLCTT